MSPIDAINVIWLAGGGWFVLGLLLYLFYRPFQETFVDQCRQELFEVRDAIFFIAYDNKLDRACYDAIRADLNMFIRYAHKLTWPRILLTILMRKRRYRKTTAWGLIDHIQNPIVRQAVESQLSHAARALIMLIVKRSLVLRLAMLVVRLGQKARKYFGVERKDVVDASASIVHDAYEEDVALHARQVREACTT